MRIEDHDASQEAGPVVAEGAGGQVNRRAFLGRAGAAAVVPAVAVLGGPLTTVADAASGRASAEVAPVPAKSLGPTPNAQGYHVGRIKGNLYWVTDSVYISMFLSTTEGVVLVDAPPTIGHNLQRAIGDVTRANGRPSKVTHLIYTHSHADHIGAASIFGPDVQRIAHEQCRILLKRDNDPHRPLPTVTFRDHHRLTVGGERLELAYHGPTVTPDTIFIYAPEYKTLMLVDIIFPGWVPFKFLGAAQDIPDWITAQRTSIQRPSLRSTGTTHGRSSAPTSMPRPPRPRTQSFKKYLGTLAGADVFTVDNAYSIFEFAVRVDGGTLGPFGVHP